MLGKVTKFGGPSLNGFEVIQLFSRGGEGGKSPPVWIGLKLILMHIRWYPE